jgi:hypothetical protein
MAGDNSAGHSTVSWESYLVRIVIGRYLTFWLSICNIFVLVRTLIRAKDGEVFVPNRVTKFLITESSRTTMRHGGGPPQGGDDGNNRVFFGFLVGYCRWLHLAPLHFASSRASSSRAKGGKALECARFLDRAAGISQPAAECLVSTRLPNGRIAASPRSRRKPHRPFHRPGLMERPQRVGTGWGRRLPEGLWGLKTGSAFRTLQQTDGSYPSPIGSEMRCGNGPSVVNDGAEGRSH